MTDAACEYFPKETNSRAVHWSASAEKANKCDAGCMRSMEDLPVDIICNILGRLTDTRSLAHFAMTSRRCREASTLSDLVRSVKMPVNHVKQVLHPDNVRHANQVTPSGFSHCLRCFMCSSIIPAPLEAIVINHRCDGLSYQFPIWTCSRVVLYRGSVDHLPQPIPCSAERLHVYNVPMPTVWPYSPLHA